MRSALTEAEANLNALASCFLASAADWLTPASPVNHDKRKRAETPDYESRYRALAEHIPAVIFVAPLNVEAGEAYVSPQIETILGFTQEEWLGDRCARIIKYIPRIAIAGAKRLLPFSCRASR